MNSPSRKKRLFINRIFDKINRGGHFLMAVYFAIFNMVPQNSFALTGGPSQPEVQSFEPIGTSEMVDLFSGDFVYNLPLLDVGGYPINLSYHSGITNDQEASWVGLGWNVNPGTINRGMRGIPDDFDGDLIHHELSTNPSITAGMNGGLDFEIFGLEDKKGFTLDVGVSAGIKYNNYKGIGMDAGANLSATIGDANSGALTGGLGLNSSSDGGLSLQPSLSLTVGLGGNSKLGSSLGTSINSRTGMTQLSINSSISRSEKGGKIGDSKVHKAKNSFSAGVGTSFDFGQPTFSPTVGMQMKTFSVSGRFKAGGAVFGITPGFHVSGYYNEQRLSKAGKSWDNPAFGYFNAQKGRYYSNATMDFNREKDGVFSESTPSLPLTNFTYDIFSVSGQGVGGSYRTFRSDVGYVFDPDSKSSSSSINMSVELGVGNLAHSGGDFSVIQSNQNSGKWINHGNRAHEALSFKTSKPYADYEPYYLKEANEKSVSSDPEFFEAMGGVEPVRLELNGDVDFKAETRPNWVFNNGSKRKITRNHRLRREKRNQILTFLNRKQLEQGLGVERAHSKSYNAPDHHVAEITTLNTAGERYIYGIAAYNLKQEDVSFATGATLAHDNALPGNYRTGLVTYSPGKDDSRDNKHGLDHYFSKTVTPAYAHSYLLTSILSSDYVDSDAKKGPSDGDLGSYTRFAYKKQAKYKWRTPVGKNQANWNDGLKTNIHDDKASYTYGEKEIWYLDSIITKNHVAVFELSDRTDAHSVTDNTGQMDNNRIMKKISKISLFSKVDLQNNGATAIPIKEVHFVYDYSLCKNLPNSSNLDPDQTGKLTLKKVYFTYQNSARGAASKYEFDYSSFNPDYNIKSYDRWGNYKENAVSNSYANNEAAVPSAEFPYVEQEKDKQDQRASAWNLNQIKLPSGGEINVEYESDDYAFVQHKRAMQMVKIMGTTNDPTSWGASTVGSSVSISNNGGISAPPQKNNYLIVELPSGYSMADVMNGISENVYFRCLTNTLQGNTIKTEKYDYVSGYADVDQGEFGDLGSSGNKNYGFLRLRGARMGDNLPSSYNPITVAAIQYSRLHLSKFVWNGTGISEPLSFGKQLLMSFLQVFKNFVSGIGNQNLMLWRNKVGNNIVAGKSFLRLAVKNKKLGGGARVKQVTISDEWNALAGGENAKYGQEYTYTLENSEVSSGVAAYEPLIGGDENPWREPVYHDKKVLLAPDEKMYQEKPFGESFFPSASVGYSRVSVKNFVPDGVNLKKHGTGVVVNEFYTTKDFPTIVKRTIREIVPGKSKPYGIGKLLNVSNRNFLTASQGFVIELNDMNGKPKATKVYAESKDSPISSKEFKYKSEALYGSSKKLKNTATVVDSEGTVTEKAQIGLVFDMVADFRRQTSETHTPSLKGNADAFLFGLLPAGTFLVYGTYSKDKRQFHSASTTKVIQRFGLLEETRVTDVGSTISTKTIAYNAETGSELISETQNQYKEDKIYSMNFPAYWFYENMGQAYKNIGFEANDLEFVSGKAYYPNSNQYFFKGDELEIVGQGTRVWVKSVNQNHIQVIKKNGADYNSVSGTKDNVRVLRSGRKNMLDGQMASLTSYSNPLTSIKSNIYEKVVQASAIEYSDEWRTYCDCQDDGTGSLATTNPFILGTEGFYKPKATYSYLTERTQTLEDGNVYLRKDGMYESFTPFYKLKNSSKWQKDYANWTFTEMITEFNPNGGQLESVDALGRFSAETYGYNNSVVTASAGNAEYKEIGFDGFEDHEYETCGDQHFRFGGSLVQEGHTGYKSLHVPKNEEELLTKQIDECIVTDCDISLTSTIDGDYTYFGVANAEAPIDVNWNLEMGSPQVLPSDKPEYWVRVKNSGTYKVQFQFTDNKGCQLTHVVSQ